MVTKYSTTTNPPIDTIGRNIIDNNDKAMNAILSGLVKFECMKVMQCESSKEMRDKLQTIYEGDDKVKEAKLQNFIA